LIDVKLLRVCLCSTSNAIPQRTAFLRIRLAGTALDEVFHRPLRGHTLEEFIHGRVPKR